MPTPKNPSLTLRYLPLAVFAFFVVSIALHPQSPLHTHELLDTDDYMRLNEVINWLQSSHPFGADWYDLSQPRLSPGEHVVVHWSRFVDLPIALVMLPFIPSFGMQNAALIASFIVPPILFALLLMLMPAIARPLIGKTRANLTTVLLLFAPAVLLNYMPGRVDHHGYQIIIAAIAVWALQRMVLFRGGWKAAIAVAIAFACALWIGTEALPWAILFSAGLAVLASWRGGFALRNAAVFGFAFPCAVAIIIPFALEPQEYGSRALSWFSAGDLIFAALAGSAIVLGWVIGRRMLTPLLRFVIMGELGVLAGVLFLLAVPDLLTGAYADYDSFFNETLINNIGEAQPLWPALGVNRYIPETWIKSATLFLHTIFLPLLAAAVVAWNTLRRRYRARAVWFIHALFLLPAVILTLFWQIRISWFVQMFCIVPAAWFIWQCWSKIQTRITGRTRFWAEILAFAAIAPLPVVLLPAFLGHATLYPDLALFPAARAAPTCPLLRATDFLNDNYSKKTRTILSGTNEGPEIMFRTNDNVIAAPYNVDGNKDAYDFFGARDERQAVRVMAKRKIDLVLVCRSIPPFYAGLETFKMRFNAFIYTDRDGHMHMKSSKERPTLIERLIDGDIPAWLKPVEIPLEPNYLLFEVKLN